MEEEKILLVDPLKSWVTIAVVGVWLLASIVALITANVTELGILTPVVMIVLGALFTIRNGNGRRRNGRDDDDDDRWSHLP